LITSEISYYAPYVNPANPVKVLTAKRSVILCIFLSFLYKIVKVVKSLDPFRNPIKLIRQSFSKHWKKVYTVAYKCHALY